MESNVKLKVYQLKMVFRTVCKHVGSKVAQVIYIAYCIVCVVNMISGNCWTVSYKPFLQCTGATLNNSFTNFVISVFVLKLIF